MDVLEYESADVYVLQYFEHVEEAVWAVEVLKATGKPVAASMCIGPDGDMHGVSPAECAVRLVKAGGYSGLTFEHDLLLDTESKCEKRSMKWETSL